jgi:hypothetical protein
MSTSFKALNSSVLHVFQLRQSENPRPTMTRDLNVLGVMQRKGAKAQRRKEM